MNSWKLFSLGAALFAGLTAILGKIGVEEIPSNMATLLRTAVVVPLLGILVWIFGEWRPVTGLSHRGVLFLALSGITTALSWACYYKALQNGPVSTVAAIDKFSFLIAILFAAVILGDRLSAWQWTGVGLMAAGLTIILVG